MRVQFYVGLIGLLMVANASMCSQNLGPNSGDISSQQEVKLCELIAKPDQYRNKVIQTEAILYSDRENSALYSPDCVGFEKYVWTDFEPGFQYGDESVKRRFNDVDCPIPRCPSVKTKVTVVGRFEGPSKKGYGHMSSYRFRLVIMRIVAAERFRAKYGHLRCPSNSGKRVSYKANCLPIPAFVECSSGLIKPDDMIHCQVRLQLPGDEPPYDQMEDGPRRFVAP